MNNDIRQTMIRQERSPTVLWARIANLTKPKPGTDGNPTELAWVTAASVCALAFTALMLILYAQTTWWTIIPGVIYAGGAAVWAGMTAIYLRRYQLMIKRS
jgi:hypothetical protein